MVCEKSVEIREICGRQLSAQCAKEQAGCFYSPTDLSDKHRCHADFLSITQIAPSARQIDRNHAGCFIKKHRFHRCARMGLFTDCLLLLRCLLLGFRCAAGAKDRHGFFACGKYDEVVCHMTGLGMRSDGHAPKGQKFIAQRQAKRRPGYNVPCSLRPARAKVQKQSVLCLLFPLQGVV